MTRIKTILFDLDGTLVHHIPAGGDVFVEYVRSCGFDVHAEDALRSERWTHFYFAHSLEIQQDARLYPEAKDFWENYSRRKLVSLGLASAAAQELAGQVSAYMAESHRPQEVIPPDAPPVLAALQSQGYFLGMVSNRESAYGEKLKELGLDSYFQFALAGGEISAFKPDRAIFARALELANSTPAETLYVGDNYFADIVGARRAGLQAALYDPANLFEDFDCQKIKTFGELSALLL
ncbi:MAG: hypothetical protein Fur002_11340 [Anaerolineales bacterium]